MHGLQNFKYCICLFEIFNTTKMDKFQTCVRQDDIYVAEFIKDPPKT
jgi:hypothetical protein